MPDLIERVETALYNAPPWWIAAVFLLVLFAAAEAGHRLRQRTVRGKEPPDDGERDMLTASLGLLALMLAFTFAMAHERYDQRRHHVAHEAAARAAAGLP